MSAKSTASLYFFSRNMTMIGFSFLELLKEKLKIHLNVHQCDTFIHDGASCHRSKLVGSFIKRIKALYWPGNNPDLISKNLCTLMKDRVSEKHLSLESLEYTIKIVWINEISSDFCQRLTDSIPKRLKAVMKNRNGYTKY